MIILVSDICSVYAIFTPASQLRSIKPTTFCKASLCWWFHKSELWLVFWWILLALLYTKLTLNLAKNRDTLIIKACLSFFPAKENISFSFALSILKHRDLLRKIFSKSVAKAMRGRNKLYSKAGQIFRDHNLALFLPWESAIRLYELSNVNNACGGYMLGCYTMVNFKVNITRYEIVALAQQYVPSFLPLLNFVLLNCYINQG